jgi:hypothetical protein
MTRCLGGRCLGSSPRYGWKDGLVLHTPWFVTEFGARDFRDVLGSICGGEGAGTRVEGVLQFDTVGARV